jgi:hypothetical protein
MINYRWRTYHGSVPEITSLWCAYMQGRGGVRAEIPCSGLVTRLRRHLLCDDFFQVLFLLFAQILKFLQLTC